MKNILLVIPREDNAKHREAMIPPGIAYINGALRAAGYPVVGINLNFREGDVETLIARAVAEHRAGYVLCGGTTVHAAAIQTVFRAAKQADKHVICIGGGAGFTSEPELFCRMTGADMAVLGEGEVTDVELLAALDAGRSPALVQGIIYRDALGYHRTAERPVVEDLDALPFPSYEDLDLEAYFENERNYDDSALFDYSFSQSPRVLPMFLGRSCPFACRFCFHTIGRKYRVRSLDNFFEELELWIEKYKINGILLMDELFGGNENVILSFCERIKQYHIPWVAEIRVELASRKVLEALRNANCRDLQLGLESMSEEVLHDMNKKISPDAIAEALKNAYELGLHVFGNYIFGAERETWDTFLTTFQWWNRHRPYQVRLLNILTYPGSAYYHHSVSRGLIPDREQFIWEKMPLVNMSQMSDYEWDKMRRVIRMTSIDNVFMGRILRIEEHQDKMDVTIRCSHCHKEFVKRDMSRQLQYTRQDYTPVCPHCGRNNRINFENFYDIMQHELMCQWIKNASAGMPYTWSAQKKYRSAVLWGGNDALTDLFIDQFGNDLQIAGVSGRRTQRLSQFNGVGKKAKVLPPSELPGQADVVIVMDPVEYVGESDYLRDIGYRGPIDSIVNFIFDMEYHLTLHHAERVEDLYECRSPADSAVHCRGQEEA